MMLDGLLENENARNADSVIGYADDTLLNGDNKDRELQSLSNRAVELLKRRGMDLNTDKAVVLDLKGLGKDKKSSFAAAIPESQG